jgi:hypothetical protein
MSGMTETEKRDLAWVEDAVLGLFTRSPSQSRSS